MAIASIAVIVIHWNQAELVADAVHTALESTGVLVRVMIVDNGSTPESTARLYQLLEGLVSTHSEEARVGNPVRLLHLDRNAGFTGANNEALHHIFNDNVFGSVEYAFLLNSDARLEPDCLEQLCNLANQDDAVGLVGALILASEDETGATVSFARSGLDKWGIPRSYDKGKQRTTLPAGPVLTVEAVGGAAMLIPRRTFSAIGGQDNRYFFDVDDTEISLRAIQAGKRNLLVLTAVAWHAMGSSVRGRTALSRYYNLRNLLLLHQTYKRGGPRFWLYVSSRIVRDLAAVLRDRDPSRLRAVIAAIADHRGQRYGIGPDWLYTKMAP